MYLDLKKAQGYMAEMLNGQRALALFVLAAARRIEPREPIAFAEIQRGVQEILLTTRQIAEKFEIESQIRTCEEIVRRAQLSETTPIVN